MRCPLLARGRQARITSLFKGHAVYRMLSHVQYSRFAPDAGAHGRRARAATRAPGEVINASNATARMHPI